VLSIACLRERTLTVRPMSDLRFEGGVGSACEGVGGSFSP